MLLSVAPALATQLFVETQRTRALGLYTASTSFSATIAPVLGGASIAWLGWSGVFWMRVPVILLTLLCLRWLPPQDPPTQRPEYSGPVLLAAAIACLLLAPSLFGADGSIGISLAFLIVGAALLLAFVHQQRASTSPYFARLRTSRCDFVLHNVANVLLHFTAFAVPLIVPYFLARAAGYGPLGIGLSLSLSPIGMLLGSSAASMVIHRLGLRQSALAAILCLGVGTFALSLGAQTTLLAPVLAALLVNGVGIGLLQVTYTDVIVATLPREARGVAGGLTMLTRTIGVVLAASVLTAAFAYLETPGADTSTDPRTAYSAAFVVLFAAVAVIPMVVLAGVFMRATMFRAPR
jgi:MFS family permease